MNHRKRSTVNNKSVKDGAKNMNKTIAIHSYKGGTGKTTISANLAYALAKKGENVCLVDLDFKAPSLHTIFQLPTNEADGKCINDVLNKDCNIDNVIEDITHKYDTPGKLYVALSDPQSDALVHMSAKGKKWQAAALKQLMDCKKHLYEMGINIIIFDTTPGVEYSSINAIATADYTMIVLKPDRTGVEGSTELIRNIYKSLKMKGGLIINQCIDDIDENINFSGIGLPVLEHIKCDCNISCKNELVSYTVAEHDFSIAIEHLATIVLEQ